VTLAAGCVFSLVLLFVFVPVRLVHTGWIAAAADAARKPTDWKREEWLEQFNLGESSFSLLARAGSILAPTVVGPLLECIQSYVGSPARTQRPRSDRCPFGHMGDGLFRRHG
jgi:hypothetical protein